MPSSYGGFKPGDDQPPPSRGLGDRSSDIGFAEARYSSSSSKLVVPSGGEVRWLFFKPSGGAWRPRLLVRRRWKVETVASPAGEYATFYPIPLLPPLLVLQASGVGSPDYGWESGRARWTAWDAEASNQRSLSQRLWRSIWKRRIWPNSDRIGRRMREASVKGSGTCAEMLACSNGRQERDSVAASSEVAPDNSPNSGRTCCGDAHVRNRSTPSRNAPRPSFPLATLISIPASQFQALRR